MFPIFAGITISAALIVAEFGLIVYMYYYYISRESYV